MSSVEDRDVSLLAVDQYMRQVWWTVRLTGEEEAQLSAVCGAGETRV